MRNHPASLTILSLCALALLGACTHNLNVIYWSKEGSSRADLERDKAECQALQRSVGADESRIHKCLEVKGWTQVQEKP